MVRESHGVRVGPEVQALPVGDSVITGHFERGRAGSQGQAQGLPIHAEAAACPAAAVLGDIAELQLVQRNFRGAPLSRGRCFRRALSERTRFCTPGGRAGCSAGRSRPRNGWSRGSGAATWLSRRTGSSPTWGSPASGARELRGLRCCTSGRHSTSRDGRTYAARSTPGCRARAGGRTLTTAAGARPGGTFL